VKPVKNFGYRAPNLIGAYQPDVENGLLEYKKTLFIFIYMIIGSSRLHGKREEVTHEH